MADPRDEDAPDPQEWQADRTPPHDLLAEQSAIGGMLLSAAVIDDVAEVARPGDFYIPKHAVIFVAILALSRRGEPTDVIAVADELTKTGQLQRAGGDAYLHQLAAITPTSANAGFYASIVADKAVLRRLVEAGTRIVQMGYASEGIPAELASNARAELDDIEGVRRSPLQLIGEDLFAFAKDLEQEPNYLPSGWPSLDTLIGGFGPGELCVVAARPGDGKSILLLQAALHAARTGVVAFSSMEMSRRELQGRMVAQKGEVNMTSLRTHSLSDQDWHRFNDAMRITTKAPVFVDDTGTSRRQTVQDVRLFVREVRKRGLPAGSPLSGVYVDYLQLVDGPGANRELEVSGVSRGLKMLAEEVEAPVIAAAQLNRGQPGRGGSRPEPTMRDLRESGGIETNASLIILIHRDPKRPHDLDLIVAKHRNGRTGKITLQWQPEYARARDRDWRQKLWGDDTDEGMQ